MTAFSSDIEDGWHAKAMLTRQCLAFHLQYMTWKVSGFRVQYGSKMSSSKLLILVDIKQNLIHLLENDGGILLVYPP